MDKKGVLAKLEKDFSKISGSLKDVPDTEESECDSVTFKEYREFFHNICQDFMIKISFVSHKQFGINFEWNKKILLEYYNDYVTFFSNQLYYGIISEKEFLANYCFSPRINEQIQKTFKDLLKKNAKRIDLKFSTEIDEYFKKVDYLFSHEKTDHFDMTWKDKFLKKFSSDEAFSASFVEKILFENKISPIKNSNKYYFLSQKITEKYNNMVDEHLTKLTSGELNITDLTDEKISHYVVREVRIHYVHGLHEKYVGNKSDFMELFIEKKSIGELKKIVLKRVEKESSLALRYYFIKEFFVTLLKNDCISIEEVEKNDAFQRGNLSFLFKRDVLQMFMGEKYFGDLIAHKMKDLSEIKCTKLITRQFLNNVEVRVGEELKKQFEEKFKQIEARGFKYIRELQEDHSSEYIDQVIDRYFKSLNFNSFLTQTENKIDQEYILKMIEIYKQNEFINIREVYYILLKGIRLLKSEGTVVDVNKNDIVIVGDLHGQMYSLLHIFDTAGYPSDKNPYIFNGDFIDKGGYTIEVLMILLAYKIVYPQSVFLTRGNHEHEVDEHFGFPNEVKGKFPKEEKIIYPIFIEAFSWLPLAILLNKSTFIIHAGIGSEQKFSINYLRKIRRNNLKELKNTDYELLIDLLWSDPVEKNGMVENKARGVSYAYGQDITEKFCLENSVKMVIRSHEMVKNGYLVTHNNQSITIHSSTTNKLFKAAFMTYKGGKMEYFTFPFMAKNFKKLSTGQKVINCCNVM